MPHTHTYYCCKSCVFWVSSLAITAQGIRLQWAGMQNASLNTSGHNLKQSFITGPHLIAYAFLAFIAFALGASAAAFFIAFFAIVVVCGWTCKGRGRKCHSRLASLSQTRDPLYRGNGNATHKQITTRHIEQQSGSARPNAGDVPRQASPAMMNKPWGPWP